MKRLLKRFIRKMVQVSGLREIIREELRSHSIQQLRDIDYGLHFKAIMDSADFVFENIPLHLRFTQYELRRMAVDAAPKGGLFLEFGVYRGYWLNQFSKMTDRPMFGFDSFEGIPDSWTLRKKGDFSVSELPQVPSNVTLIKGWFKDTLPEFMEKHDHKIDFIHLDCDLYSSTREVLEVISGNLRSGTVIVLDDFFEEPGWQNEEHKAFFEFIEKEKVEFEYLGYSYGIPSSSVAVRITGVGKVVQRGSDVR